MEAIIKCRSKKEYSFVMWNGECNFHCMPDSTEFLTVVSLKPMEFTEHDIYGAEIFDTIIKETKIMSGIYKSFLDGVLKKETEFIVPDCFNYDGTGVELRLQCGYMTAGYRMNLSDMTISILPTKVFADLECNVTICAEMEYERKDKKDIRNIRLGSGKGFDEALSNAKTRINGLLGDVADIEEWLFEELYVKNKRFYIWRSIY